MVDFAELFGMLREPGEDGLPETIYDDLQAAYTEDIGIRDAKIAELDAAAQAAANEISALKSKNYDLLMQTAVEPTDGDGAEEPGPDSDSEDSDPIDGLFENGEDN